MFGDKVPIDGDATISEGAPVVALGAGFPNALAAWPRFQKTTPAPGVTKMFGATYSF